MTSNKEDNEKSYKIPVGKDINKVHVTMTEKHKVDNIQGLGQLLQK